MGGDWLERGDRLEGGDWLEVDTLEDHLSKNHLSDVGWFGVN